MNDQILTLSRSFPPTSMARRIVHSAFRGIRHGRLEIQEHGSSQIFGERNSRPSAAVQVHDKGLWARLLIGGTVGAGEAYSDGAWSSEDLVAVIRVLLQNEDIRHRLEGGWSRLRTPLMKLFHRMRDNTKQQSVRNIRDHYDVGNDFFALFLDPTMTYSSGIFESTQTSMEDASKAKLHRLCKKLELKASDHLLEIGTGWGSLAIYAAKNFGCRVTTTTVSSAQYQEATERVRQAGLSDRITVLNQDYRDLSGQFDKLVSVEMVEAVGHRHLPEYFHLCAERLRPNGRFVIQAITLPAQAYARSLGRVDFIQRHVFPGSQVPSMEAMTAAWSSHSPLRLCSMEEFGPHYALTLKLWREALLARRSDAHALGFSDNQLRSWEFYLAYCEAGFSARHLGLVQLVLDKPGVKDQPLGLEAFPIA